MTQKLKSPEAARNSLARKSKTDREQRDDARSVYQGHIDQSTVQGGKEVWARVRDRWREAEVSGVGCRWIESRRIEGRRRKRPTRRIWRNCYGIIRSLRGKKPSK